MKHKQRSEKASQILDLMDSLDLEAAIRAELYEEWRNAKPDEWHVVHGKHDVLDLTMKILRRIANG